VSDEEKIKPNSQVRYNINIDKVDRFEARSVRSYKEFKEALRATADGEAEEDRSNVEP
jgi:hypothetical protein